MVSLNSNLGHNYSASSMNKRKFSDRIKDWLTICFITIICVVAIACWEVWMFFGGKRPRMTTKHPKYDPLNTDDK